MMIGSVEIAKKQLAEAVRLAPSDKLATHYVQQLEAHKPLTPPEMASKPGGTAF
jgi:hypothetical protein